MKINLEDLSRFASSMATCLGAGMPPAKALDLSRGTSRSRGLQRAVDHAIEACQRGNSISDGLETSGRELPEFVVPVVRAGEISGRQIEAYELIHAHCERLKLSVRLVRNTWLYPVICIAAGWLAQTTIFLYFGRYAMAWEFARETFISTAALIAVGWALLRMPVGKRVADWLVLQVPFVRETVVRSAVVLFLATFRLCYEAGGLGVLETLDVALATVRNGVIRDDLAAARPILEENGAFEDAFAEPSFLHDSIKSSIAAGAISGSLGTSLEQIVRAETQDLVVSLELFNRIFQRLVAYAVAMSVVGTILMCLAYSAGG